MLEESAPGEDQVTVQIDRDDVKADRDMTLAVLDRHAFFDAVGYVNDARTTPSMIFQATATAPETVACVDFRGTATITLDDIIIVQNEGHRLGWFRLAELLAVGAG